MSSSTPPVSGYLSGFTPCSLGMGRLLLLPVRVGKTWTDTWNTGSAGGCQSVTAQRMIQARNEKVHVRAGAFASSVLVRTELTTARTPGSSTDATWKGYEEGTRLDWYAPDVGLVKIEYRHANGHTTRVDLVDYQVKRRESTYLPNRAGNTWRYEWRDEAGKVLFREFWQIAARRGSTTYLAYGAYECK